jgi:hypothetical protein
LILLFDQPLGFAEIEFLDKEFNKGWFSNACGSTDQDIKISGSPLPWDIAFAIELVHIFNGDRLSNISDLLRNMTELGRHGTTGWIEKLLLHLSPLKTFGGTRGFFKSVGSRLALISFSLHF